MFPSSFPFALYVHVPFCAVRCAYCDFNTFAGLDAWIQPYSEALIDEIRRAGATRNHPPVRTIFLGGGTPTLLPPGLLQGILAACFEAFDVAPDAEITCEANPGTTDSACFAWLRAMGVNRLSMGVQSFDDAELAWLGRIHGAAEAEAAFFEARRSGFSNISLDFMFGIPGQRVGTWRLTLERALRLSPEHLSLYGLTVEHGTPLADQVRRGLVASPDDDLAAELYEVACTLLGQHGYQHYEISNWAKLPTGEPRAATSDLRPPASILQCQHNLVYWHREPYLGFGPGAHSFDGGRRWWNVKPVPEYVRRLRAGRSPERDGEDIDRRTAMGEAMMLGLRLVQEGMPEVLFRERFGLGLEEAFGTEIECLVGRGLLERVAGAQGGEPSGIRLTHAGRLLGNQVFAEFLSTDP